jgi:hypothetical protein
MLVLFKKGLEKVGYILLSLLYLLWLKLMYVKDMLMHCFLVNYIKKRFSYIGLIIIALK